MLQIRESHSRIVERVDLAVDATVFGFVEGNDIDDPITFGINKADHFSDLHQMTLDEVSQFGQAILDYVARVLANRPLDEPPNAPSIN